MLAMVVLWLCSVAHPKQRMTIDGHAHHLSLPQSSSWLKCLLEDKQVRCSWATSHVRLADKFKLRGLIQVDMSQMRPWNGSLTSWSKEAFLLHDYYQGPVDSFVVPATAAFKLDDGRKAYLSQDG